MDLATREGISNGHLIHHGHAPQKGSKGQRYHGDGRNYSNHSADEFDQAEKGHTNGMKNNHSTSNSGRERSTDKPLSNEEGDGKSKYLSKEYKVHWREKERIQKVINKEKELEKDFLKREKEWIELEQQIKNDTYKEWNKLLQIQKKDIAKLIESDLKGEQENAHLSTSKKREMRNSKRKKEKELDDLDRLSEMREAEEAQEAARRKEQAERDRAEAEEAAREVNREAFKESAREASRGAIETANEAAKDAPPRGENQAEKEKSDQLAEDATGKANNQQESKDSGSVSKPKSSFFMNALSFVFDRGSEGKVEKKGDEALAGEAAEGEKQGRGTADEEVDNDNAVNEAVDNAEKTCEENCAEEEAEYTPPVDARTSKRKSLPSEPINIKVNERKKKKNTGSESARSVSTRRALQNVFSTNDEDDLFAGKKRPLAKLGGKGKDAEEGGESPAAATSAASGEESVQTVEVIENSKKILEMVPSSEEEIFNFPIDWKVLNQKGNIITKLKPWISKKIMEYIGSEEKEITGQISDYFVDQILKQRAPKEMLVEAEKFLDADGKKFILNMYRLIIFEQLKVTNAM
ncbi:hypothetical protein C922_03285 [Plasmodium inui San Antonio 1]|uniref:PWI domain-containing protein n=1 Tax=Plasmodium inui San Antonio 1 TaxID=1237626 RepID=W7ABA7_9APIC|nr:hypothetical protein C922_03285 [Plasmodium inui San Antonio 1]EUD66369.1 hypothetical protein C922_03285 [Plasmodium inui San Antonio 1]